MAYAYTPGLKVTTGSTIRKDRSLPLKGDVLVQRGDAVRSEDVVARTNRPGNVQLVNVANLLSIPPEDVKDYMHKTEGEAVAKDETLAMTKGIFGLFRSQARSPIDGTIETISKVTGQVILREPPLPVEMKAFINGTVVEVFPDKGVVVEAYGTYVQGIFGVGGEAVGTLNVVVDSPNAPLTPDAIQTTHRGKILVGGSIVGYDALQEAIRCGVKGVVAGGINDTDLRKFLGYELGVAITGTEALGITLIITEGFGKISMAGRTYNLLKDQEGMQASINGATQIRAGVVRPEIVIPFEKREQSLQTAPESGVLEVDTPIRIIREPYFGQLGRVTALPVELQQLETEANVRVLEVELDDGVPITLPRANVEIIEA